MKVLTDNKYYGQIADVIREQNGTNNTYTPPQMVSALKDLFYEEVEGVPPISFNGIGENLLDYRIDGASGGVGDRTSNLYNSNLETNTLINASLVEQSSNDYKLSDYIIIPNDGLKISGFINLQSGDAIRFILYDTNKNIIERLFKVNTVVDINNTQGVYLRINYNINMWDMSNLMAVAGTTTPLIYEPYGYKVPVMVEGKNLLQHTATSQTINGVTFTVNADGSVTCNTDENGATANTRFYLVGVSGTDFTKLNINANAIITGCPPGGSTNTYSLFILRRKDDMEPNKYNTWAETGNGFNLPYNETNKYVIFINILMGTICNNLTFYPMIRKADIEDDTYEPYHEPTTTNIYLDKPIEAKANIPSEYTEVEYLESTGTQYIDTGFVPNSNSGFKTKIVFSGYTDGIDDFIIGLRSNDNTYGRFAYTCTDFNNITFYCSFGTTTSSSYRYNSNMPSSEIIECELNYKNSNTTITQGVEGLLPDKNNFIGEGLSFYLAGAYNAKGIPKYKAMRQYECELTQGTEVVRDLVPCYRKSDNVAGLYDLVNNTFYTNQGTGNFIVGPIKENESISLSDTNTNIPTIRGTNVLTVDTTVQPSNVYVKAKKESQYETIMRERYEEAQAQLEALESGGE